jgi:basic membrane lipoprotein Med (substrate-binding protein (PBP1-ABC) superfamily)
MLKTRLTAALKNLVWLQALILGLCVLCLTGCTTHDLTAEAKDKKAKVGIVFDIGGKDDRSFNAAANIGMLRAKQELPILLRDVEPGDPTSIEPAIRAFALYGFNLITGVGFAQGPILEEVAKDYPQLHFVIIDSVVEAPNVASLLFKEHEGSFLVGMIAAYTSKTGKLGFVGGMDIPEHPRDGKLRRHHRRGLEQSGQRTRTGQRAVRTGRRRDLCGGREFGPGRV